MLLENGESAPLMTVAALGLCGVHSPASADKLRGRRNLEGTLRCNTRRGCRSTLWWGCK